MIKMNYGHMKTLGQLDAKSLRDVAKLEGICTEHDGTSLKLELDYKKAIGSGTDTSDVKAVTNEFLYYIDEQLVGYIGICSFGGSTMEVDGMVHQDFRRKGIFTELFQQVKETWLKRDEKRMLLLSDKKAEEGIGFVGSVGGVFEHAEYEMYLNRKFKVEQKATPIQLRRATNADADEIAAQNAIYFKDEFEANHGEEAISEHLEDVEDVVILPEEEAKNDMYIYMAEVGGDIIGKVHLHVTGDTGGIYGVGVKPHMRRKGYGREILNQSVVILQEMGCSEVMLQVAAKNDGALDLYRSCGFEVDSTMLYYEIKA